LLSVLHLTQGGNQSACKTGRHDKQTAWDGDDIEVKDLKEIKENYKEVNGRSEKLKSIAEARAELLRKMSIK